MIYKTAVNAVTAFGKEEDGQDLVEYSLLLGVFALAGAGLLSGMGTTIESVFTTVNSGMSLARNAVS